MWRARETLSRNLRAGIEKYKDYHVALNDGLPDLLAERAAAGISLHELQQRISGSVHV